MRLLDGCTDTPGWGGLGLGRSALEEASGGPSLQGGWQTALGLEDWRAGEARAQERSPSSSRDGQGSSSAP